MIGRGKGREREREERRAGKGNEKERRKKGRIDLPSTDSLLKCLQLLARKQAKVWSSTLIPQGGIGPSSPGSLAGSWPGGREKP